MIDYKFAGILGNIFFFIIWIILYYHKKQLRKEMLLMSLLIAPLGPISELFFTYDYWQPVYWIKIFWFGFSDILFGFFIGGIASVIYEEYFITKIRKSKREHSKEFAYLALLGAIIFFLLFAFGINSIYANIISFILIGLMIIYKRHDLWKNAIGSGIIVAILMFLFYIIFTMIFPTIIQDWWMLNNISGIIILGAPLEEIIWGFSWGFLAGPIYEFWKGVREK